MRVHRDYLDRLVKVIGTEDIKVITGVRRSGKSYLLHEFEDYLKNAYPDANVISIDYASLYAEKLREYHALHEYVESRYMEKVRNFVLIDEVQMCEGFELAINSLHAMHKYDIYVTGSNAFIDGSRLATLFVGRTFTIEIFPFSFKEFMDYFNYRDQYEGFMNYLKIGGFAGSYRYSDSIQRQDYVAEVYKTIITRDIEQKYHLKYPMTLEAVSDFLTDNISRLTSIRKITGALVSNHVKTNDKTIGNYVKYLCEAYAFYRVRRFDIKGKLYLSSIDKYYLADHSIKAARLGGNSPDYGSLYENIVAIELLRRGYEIYVGTMRNAEIDFLAMRRGEQYYIQVAQRVDDEKTLERELGAFRKLNDGYPRLILATTKQPTYSREGVKIADIADWLLTEQM